MPDSVARSAFPNILRRYMDRDNLSQVAIAKHLNVSKQSVSEWLKGKKFPKVEHMQELADLFGVLMSDMYTPTSRSKTDTGSQAEILDDSEKHLIDSYRALSPRGQQLLLDRAEELKLLYGKKPEDTLPESV